MLGRTAVLTVLTAALASAADEGRVVDAAKAQDHRAAVALIDRGADVNLTQGDGGTALHWAAHWDDLELARRLLRAGAKVNAADESGVTALFLASTNRNAAMAELLLKAGANPRLVRQSGVTPLMAAARTGDASLVRMLLAGGAETNAKESSRQQTALMWASAENHLDVVRLLLENGADVGARTPARQTPVAVSGQFAGGECCLPNYVGGFTPLLFAVQQGHVDVARLLLGAGADINDRSADGSSALVLAIDSAPVASDRVAPNALAAHDVQRTMAKFLIDQGADVNASGGGRTALHSAVQRKMPDLVRALLAKGANANARLERRLPSVSRDVGLQNGLDVNTLGATPFWLAAGFGDAETMRVLLAGGADPSLVSKDGTSALMVAAGIDFVDGQDKYGVRTFDEDITPLVTKARDAVLLCLEAGLDVKAANDNGQTALFGAVYLGSPMLVQLLVDRGAPINIRNRRGQTPWLVAARGEYRAGSFFVKKEAGDRLEALGADKSLGADLGKESLSIPRPRP